MTGIRIEDSLTTLETRQKRTLIVCLVTGFRIQTTNRKYIPDKKVVIVEQVLKVSIRQSAVCPSVKLHHFVLPHGLSDATYQDP